MLVFSLFRRRNQSRDLFRDHQQPCRYHRIHAQNVPVPVLYLIYHSLASVSSNHMWNSNLVFRTKYIIFIYVIAGNAELTSLFKCKKHGYQCCAPKSLIKELHGGNSTEPILTNRNDTSHITSRPYTTPFTTSICK